MHHRRRRLAVGMALAAVVAGAGLLVASGSSAQPASGAEARLVSPTTVPVTAAVDAHGVAVASSEDWAVRRAAPGTYELVFQHDVRVDLRTWEVPSAVTVRPVGDRRWDVSFVADGAPVDTAFSFRAVAVEP